MSTIEKFIAARLDEDEEGARAAGSAPWTADGLGVHVDPRAVAANKHAFRAEYIASVGHDRYAQHIARHDPARVLRQCAALRSVLDTYRLFNETRDYPAEAWIAMRDGALRPIAAIWSDHRDYDPSWAPDTGGSKP